MAEVETFEGHKRAQYLDCGEFSQVFTYLKIYQNVQFKYV